MKEIPCSWIGESILSKWTHDPRQSTNSKKAVSNSVQFSRSVMSDSLRPHESQHARPPCPSPTPRVHSNSCPLGWWCHPAISSSVSPFSSCPQSLPASGPFPMSQLFTWGGQSTGVSASASVLPMNTQDWSPLPIAFFTELEQKKSKSYIETQNTPKAKAILRKKNGAWRIRLLEFRLYYKATIIKAVWYWTFLVVQWLRLCTCTAGATGLIPGQETDLPCHVVWLKNSTALAQRQKNRSAQQDRKPRNKLMHLWSTNLQQRRQEKYTMEKDSLFNKWYWENWTATSEKWNQNITNTIDKNKLEMDQRLKCKAGHHKTLRGKHRQNTLWHKLQQYLSWFTS